MSDHIETEYYGRASGSIYDLVEAVGEDQNFAIGDIVKAIQILKETIRLMKAHLGQ